eukprot:CAMPEP_0178436426 /NCGR_PEP_ID=MMETSP0689_2-20121128/34433_1 /TAXON_ID=160604 /ORGANISM="Amphidinium massartii, Strain CS-259" /LENGTH=191 /DNA_ID=CAMNT_0020058521 /DNA_START=170 /DNA_END=745 /DNA_ORIENTATION=+
MTGKSTSGQACAFVVYAGQAEADAAITALDGAYSIREGEPPIQVKLAKQGGPTASPAVRVPPPTNVMSFQTPAVDMTQMVAPLWGQAAPPPPPSTGLAMGNQPRKLFVGNLPSDIAQEALMQVFNTYGMVTNVHIMAGKAKSGQSCAFVEYGDPGQARIACDTLHEKYEIRPGDGPIVVKFASNQNRSSPY